MVQTTDDTVVHYAYQTAEGFQETFVTLTERSDQRPKHIVCASPWVIPVVFVPGVMGTNLKLKDNQDGETVWQPPNSKVGGLPLLFDFLFKGPKARQERFNPANAEVDWNGPIQPGPVKLNEPEGAVATLRKRGWGSVYADSYHGLLQNLHEQLNDTALLKAVAAGTDLPTFWAKLTQDPREWGSTSAQAKPLEREQLRHLCRYRFDIWACGYNWLQSNLDSGKDLHAYIQKVLKTYQDAGCVRPGAPPMKVIVVTHSMGGLVLRGLLQIPGSANNLLGVVHGVQPAAGAPAVYKRMRAGFEGIEQVVLGRNAPEAVPVLANAPALLEMLPFASYNRGQAWLKAGTREWPARDKDGAANPYKDIYASPAWYGLIPERNNALIDPAGIVAKRIGLGKSVREDGFHKSIEDVELFHTVITSPGQDYHPQTWAHGAVEQSRKTWGEVQWVGHVPEGTDLQQAQLLKDDGNDRIELTGGVRLQIAEPQQSGDGTVPAWSLAAPHDRVKDLALHGSGMVPGQAGLNARRVESPQAKALQPGYEHQNSYKDERALWASFHAIVQAAQLANWAPVPVKPATPATSN
jgi:hypothetical protein